MTANPHLNEVAILNWKSVACYLEIKQKSSLSTGFKIPNLCLVLLKGGQVNSVVLSPGEQTIVAKRFLSEAL